MLQTFEMLRTPPMITAAEHWCGAYEDGFLEDQNAATHLSTDAVRCVHYRGNGIGLYRAADAESSNGCEHGKQHSHLTPSQATFQSIHRTTKHTPTFRLHTVFYSKQRLGILRRNAEHAGKPAPEHRSRTA